MEPISLLLLPYLSLVPKRYSFTAELYSFFLPSQWEERDRGAEGGGGSRCGCVRVGGEGSFRNKLIL